MCDDSPWISAYCLMTACALAVLAACATSPRPPVAAAPQARETAASSDMNASSAPADAIGSPADAMAQLDRSWVETLAPHLGRDRSRVVEHWQAILADASASRAATTMPCLSGAERIRDTLGPSEQESILYGTLDDLASGDRCWEVTVSAGFDSLIVYFSADEGRLLLAWWPPEG